MRSADMVGQRFERLVVISRAPSQGKDTMWCCLCDCGARKIASGGNLRKGHVKSCGCLQRESPRLNPRPSRAIDMTGRRFSRLAVASLAKKDDRGELWWRCLCDCGSEVEVRGHCLRKGTTKSCGCLMADNARALFSTHGMTGSPEHRCWLGIHRRCTDPANRSYHRYGGRGIRVCERWHSFDKFYADMGPTPSPRHSIERIDNNGDYEPGNCKWLPWREQHWNKSNTRFVRYKRKRVALARAIHASTASVSYGCVKERLRRGWPAEAALETPTRPKAPARMVVYRGSSPMRLSDAVVAAGNVVTLMVARNRLNTGWTVEDALETPVNAHRHPPEK